MAEYIVMPKLGFDMREGVLVGWSKNIGDSVEKGEVIAEIESDKATLELEAQTAGVLLELLAQEGDVVPIGGHMAIVGEAGENISALSKTGAEPHSTTEEKPEREETTPIVAETGRPAEAHPVTDAGFPGGVKATPVARRIAEEHGLDVRLVQASRPGGRIRKGDVEAYLAKGAPAVAPRAESKPVLSGSGAEDVPISRLRQAIGRRMVESKTTVPHFYVTNEIDMGPALALRKQLNVLLPDEQKVTINDMIVKAAALALLSFPNLNASFAGDKIIRHSRINVGTAVAVEGGLLTVVQQNTDQSPLARIAADNKMMIARAREGKSKPADFESGTFTISNLGALEVDHFIAIINPPDAAILAVGSARQVAVVVDGELSVGWRMKATISADHRVTDGAEAAAFMQRLKAILEEPLRLLL